MDNFNLYAKYYDLLYTDKDYSDEASYIDALIKKFQDLETKSILDLGCGTGNHANLLSELGYTVDGVDIAPEMIERAKQKFSENNGLNFYLGDITKFNNEKQYDAVISLFHVLSYQNSNTDVLKSMQTAYNHLKPGGLFIFDYWYGPAVLTDLPQVRTKEIGNDEILVLRNATPKMHYNENIVDVNYAIEITDKVSHRTDRVNEKHSMRYFFKPELALFLEHFSFTKCKFYEWMTFTEPGSKSWNALTIAKKDI
ncbi:SAM-dependent methyltransferase [Pukyongia salina]|uniref:SAM-dependent methyltransferase n=1 Tax=Pukyongia salina TaxID=2094025 RepID=A0A2S0HZ08_9FLAO|nr:class I SAM-dependent methyltransferase [Pukyongia salina]AVI51423.1 SAM-dependent methyltransferase [Pukyongia salina]